MAAGLAVAALFFASCSRERGVAQAPPPVSSGAQGGLAVKILPEAPLSTNDLQAAVSGKGNAALQWHLNNVPLAGENAPALPRGRFSKGDRVTVTAAADGSEVSASVTIGNAPPRVISVPFSPQALYAGVDLTVTPVAADADGDTVGFRYAWSINGQGAPENSPTLRGDSFRRGDRIVVTVTPYDGDGEGLVFIGEPLIVPNARPVFVSAPPQEFRGETYVYRAEGADPDGDVLAYSLASAPAGMTIDERTGMITWKIGREQAGRHSVEVVARDQEGAKAFQRYTLSITMSGEVGK